MSSTACPDPTAISAWHTALAVMSGLLLLALLLALLTLWRTRRVGAVASLFTALSASLVVATEVSSVALWMRFRETIAVLAVYFPAYPSNCMTDDETYGRFSPPPGFWDALQPTIAQVTPLERAAALDVAAGALAAVIACALMWGRRRAPIPETI